MGVVQQINPKSTDAFKKGNSGTQLIRHLTLKGGIRCEDENTATTPMYFFDVY